jgi:uracil-DNA glycosylase family 4
MSRPAAQHSKSIVSIFEPDRDCGFCPRLAAFRTANRAIHPAWFNAPVPSFGDAGARLLIVGLAPGLKGANRTGRPFTGDYAGELLYETLLEFGFATGEYRQSPDDGLKLQNAIIANAVRCVPPENKPVPSEILTCNQFLKAQIAALPNLVALLALGQIAHNAVLMALGEKRSPRSFAHGARHDLQRHVLFDSYHCSRYNTNTGRLTPRMFKNVFGAIRATLGSADGSGNVDQS